MENVCRLHRPGQGMPKGHLPTSPYRLNSRLHCGPSHVEFHERLDGVQPNLNEPRRLGEGVIHYRQRVLLLHSYAFRPQECESYLPEAGKPHVQGANRA